MSDMREEHMRTALILARTATMLEEALSGRFLNSGEARDALAQARRRQGEVEVLLWPEKAR